MRFLFRRFRGAVRHDILFGQIAGFHKIFKCVLRDDGANPITGSGCFGRHYEEGSLKREMSGSIISRRKFTVQHSKWRLMKGPNDTWLIPSGYLSRCGRRE